MHSIKSNGTYWQLSEAYGMLWKLMEAYESLWRLKWQLYWNFETKLINAYMFKIYFTYFKFMGDNPNTKQQVQVTAEQHCNTATLKIEGLIG